MTKDTIKKYISGKLIVVCVLISSFITFLTYFTDDFENKNDFDIIEQDKINLISNKLENSLNNLYILKEILKINEGLNLNQLENILSIVKYDKYVNSVYYCPKVTLDNKNEYNKIFKNININEYKDINSKKYFLDEYNFLDKFYPILFEKSSNIDNKKLGIDLYSDDVLKSSINTSILKNEIELSYPRKLEEDCIYCIIPLIDEKTNQNKEQMEGIFVVVINISNSIQSIPLENEYLIRIKDITFNNKLIYEGVFTKNKFKKESKINIEKIINNNYMKKKSINFINKELNIEIYMVLKNINYLKLISILIIMFIVLMIANIYIKIIRERNKKIQKELENQTIELKKEIVIRENAEIKLNQLEDAKSIIITTINHETRTPMVSILGYSELLLNRKLDEETIKKYIKNIYKGAKSLSNVLSEFIDIHKILSGKYKITKKDFDLKELIKNSISNFEYKFDSKANFLCEGNDFNVFMDEGKIKQVITNLMSNADKYSEEKEFDIRLVDKTKYVMIIFEDYGCGILDEEINNAFSIFFKTKYSIEKHIDGAGLGLYICKKIINEHDGKIRIESTIMKGTKVIIEIPKNTNKELR